MEVIDINIREDNRLTIDNVEYFLFLKQGKVFIIPTKCPHRGGPLHLGHTVDQGELLVCPWHENKYKTSRLHCKAFATLQVRERLTMVVDAKEIAVWHEKGIVNSSMETSR